MGRPPATLDTERYCYSCSARLSRYNLGTYCALHQRQVRVDVTNDLVYVAVCSLAPATSPMIAAALGMESRQLRYRLDQLCEAGRLTRGKEPRVRFFVYSPADAASDTG